LMRTSPTFRAFQPDCAVTVQAENALSPRLIA
jgi:hypothetical protein